MTIKEDHAPKMQRNVQTKSAQKGYKELYKVD